MDALDGRRVSEAIRIEAATGRFSVARSNYTDPALFRTEMDRISRNAGCLWVTRRNLLSPTNS